MNQLLVFIPLAILFLFVLLYWVLQSTGSAVGHREPSDAQEALSRLELELPPRVLAEKIFSLQDWDFVSRETPISIQRTFLREHKAIALSWLRRTRRQASRLIKFYRTAVRGSIKLSPAVEIRLAANYILFLLVYGGLLCLIRLGGPFHARKMARYAIGVAEQLWVLSEQLLAGVDPAFLRRASGDWTAKSQ